MSAAKVLPDIDNLCDHSISVTLENRVAESGTEVRRSRPSWYEYLFALRVFLWLFWAAARLRLTKFSDYLKCLLPRETEATALLDVERAVHIICRVCQMRCFRQGWFPRICLRQSLALYRFLSRMGHPVLLHFSVNKDAADSLIAHSWVSLRGEPLAGDGRPAGFRDLLIFPTPESRTSELSQDTNVFPPPFRPSGV